jgi:hypothetical protein
VQAIAEKMGFMTDTQQDLFDQVNAMQAKQAVDSLPF